jgi:cobalt-zinc-cadmium efflux system protein
MLRQALNLSLDAVPAGIDPAAVRTYLAALPGVSEVHDLHIWGLSTTESALTVHLIRPGAALDDDWLAEVSHALHDRFHIGHATIQVENGQGQQSCRLAPEDVVWRRDVGRAPLSTFSPHDFPNRFPTTLAQPPALSRVEKCAVA